MRHSKLPNPKKPKHIKKTTYSVGRKLHTKLIPTKGVKRNTMVEIKPDNDLIEEAINELKNRKSTKPRYQSKLPRNRYGVPIIMCSAGKTARQIYEEDKGLR